MNRSNASGKSKIPLQNNGTLAFYKNINLFKPCRKTYSQLRTHLGSGFIMVFPKEFHIIIIDQVKIIVNDQPVIYFHVQYVGPENIDVLRVINIVGKEICPGGIINIFCDLTFIFYRDQSAELETNFSYRIDIVVPGKRNLL